MATIEDLAASLEAYFDEKDKIKKAIIEERRKAEETLRLSGMSDFLIIAKRLLSRRCPAVKIIEEAAGNRKLMWNDKEQAGFLNRLGMIEQGEFNFVDVNGRPDGSVVISTKFRGDGDEKIFPQTQWQEDKGILVDALRVAILCPGKDGDRFYPNR